MTGDTGSPSSVTRAPGVLQLKEHAHTICGGIVFLAVLEKKGNVSNGGNRVSNFLDLICSEGLGYSHERLWKSAQGVCY